MKRINKHIGGYMVKEIEIKALTKEVTGIDEVGRRLVL